MKKTKSNVIENEFFAQAQELIITLNEIGQFGTAQNYAKACSSFRTFLNSGSRERSIDTLPVEEIDSRLITRYNHFLSGRGVIRNTVSFYNRALRAIYNKIVRQTRIPDRHPFDEVYTGVDRTHNRAMSETAISKLVRLDFNNDKSLELTRDLFIFSYMMRGMPFVDMAYLRKRNIQGGYLIYYRKKTGTRMQVRIEPEARAILSKYARRDSDYILPILQCTNMDEKQTYLLYQSRLSIYNRHLKTIASIIQEPISLTSYVSRHSWATAARNSRVGMSIISEGLGHSSERTTRIYLGTFDARLIDNANRKLVGKITKCVSPQETNTRQRYA